MFLGKKNFVPENSFVSLKKLFLKFYEVRSERGDSIDADSGPPRYVLWCCGGICHQILAFFKIGCGHTVLYLVINLFSLVFGFCQKLIKRYYITYKMFRKSDGLENQMRKNSSEVFVIAR